MTVATVASAADDAKGLHAPRADEGALTETAEDIVVDKAVLEGLHSRTMGDTEHNWCRAVGSGTGITVLAVLFSRPVEVSALQRAVDSLQIRHPRLRSELVWIDGKPAFQVGDSSHVEVEVIDARNESSARGSCEEVKEEVDEMQDQEDRHCGDMQDAEEHDWMNHVESELNTNLWPEQHHSLAPQKMLVVRLYLRPRDYSLLVFRVHTAVCDRVAAATLLVDLLRAMRHCPPPSPLLEDDYESSPVLVDGESLSDSAEMRLMSVEDAIPPGQANKPFWAHGIDLLGYSLGSRRHALLPFDNPMEPRRSKVIHSVLSVEQTQQLLAVCQKENTNIYGVLCAAGLKAAAIMKQLARRSEHYALCTLIDCRQYLEPKLPQSVVGFYHSALMNTHHVNEITDFWELARRCSTTLENAMKNRKHFTDMGDLNFLMYQAISHPALTPSSSMRTSQLVLFRDPILVQMEDLAKEMGVEHYLGCSSIHGVGPALAMFDSVRKGALHITSIYPSPLYSRSQMRTYVSTMLELMVHSSQK
ncbi:hypothetical protein MPTK1_1g22120 [Marchantia polymorpha subsp. ruderalis]|uniref:Phthiocerol/phthiodiolone dimycocerosyl transferase C-terminal domain-containing protein n=2 Tax=Marchantia polymorpha TaxID=3197 RepID=A0AAF6AT05_MARPO|nr:hypothetical protein MARPO_0001s0549 [Marchantia polymorpha]BBM99575.1 hypothetical protein Mp_1g22120 [Marchantia polymorpha subsp. ruderalis]|eukprot:PTQ50662.1 hypothetical protein MARPO_0001s0549 [Marchantia polymorpha]